MEYERIVEYYPKRSIYDLSGGIPDNAGDCVLICLPRLGWLIARSFLSERGLWDTSYASEYDDQYYKTLSEQDFDTVQTYVSNAIGACVMSCEDLVNAIDGVALAISQSGSCAGGAGSSTATQEPESPIDFEDNGSNYPDGWPDRAAYLDDKCLRANTYVGGWINDVAWIETIGISTLVITAFIGALFTPVPGDEVIALIALLATLVLEGTATAMLNAVQTWLDDEKENLVCILYQAVSVDDAIAGINAKIDAELSGAETLFAKFFVGTSALNSLFSPVRTLLGLDTGLGIDCAGCSDAIWGINTLICTSTVVSGDFTEGTPTRVSSCEGLYFGTVRAGQNTGAQPAETDDRDVLIQSLHGATGDFYVTWRIAGVDNSETINATALEGKIYEDAEQMQIIRSAPSDTTPFDVTYVVTLPV